MENEKIVRRTIKSATDEEIALANKEGKLTGNRRYLPTDEAIGKIYKEKMISPARGMSFITHPDENVPITFLNRQYYRYDWPHKNLMLEGTLWRAIKEARAEGLIWTPLLKARTQHLTWGGGDTAKAGLKGARPERGRTKTAKDREAKYKREEDPLIQEFPDNETLPGFNSYFAEIEDRLAALPVEERQQATRGMPETLTLLVMNMTRADEWTPEVLAGWIVRSDYLGSQLLKRPDLDEKVKRGAESLMAKLLPGDNSYPYRTGDEIARLGWFREEPLRGIALARARSAEPLYIKQIWRWLTTQLERQTDAQWAEVHERLPKVVSTADVWLLENILNDPRLSLADVELMLSHIRLPYLGRILSISKAINIPGVAERLARSKNLDIHRNLATQSTPETYGRIFKKMAKTAPNIAISSLTKREEEVGEYIQRKDMSPLFMNEDKSKRLKAIELSGRIARNKPGLPKKT